MSNTIATDELLLSALLALEDGDEDMSLSAIVRGIERQRGVTLAPEERDALEQLLRREGTQYVRAPQPPGDGWSITPEGQIYVRQQSIEPEDLGASPVLSTESSVDKEIVTPFNPALIKVETEQMPVYHVLKLLNDHRLVLQPEFQRNFIWDDVRQSRLIESMLLRIPLPAFYFDATRDSTYLVVDGLQRLTTLDRFCNQNSLKLTGLEHLRDLKGNRFKDLPLPMQTMLTERTKLTVYTILPETPPQVKFTIFGRVNTGGLVLTAQEIRHALYRGRDGRAAKLLQGLAESQPFWDATSGSVSPKRMDDRECVLRFIAFRQYPYEEFGSRLSEGEPANLDGLLNRTMQDLNELSLTTHDQIREVFNESMIKAQRIFGRFAFRKLYGREYKRQPVSKPLFEVWSVLLTQHALEDLERRRDRIVDGFIDVMQTDIDFVNSISYGTGSSGTVRYRFRRIQRLLQEVMG